MRVDRSRFALVFASLITLGATEHHALRPAAPVDATDAIFQALRTHSIVAMSAGHHDDRGQAFVMALLRDPRFPSTVNDIVLECCSARYQDVIDRYVGGEDVSDTALAQSWRNSTQVNADQRDNPVAMELFRAVRALNLSLSPERKLRIVFGDPPIDWHTVKTSADHRKWIEKRDAFPADLIERDILARQRKALVLYGGMHLQRKNLAANYESEGLAETLISRLELATGKRAFTIWPVTDVTKFQQDTASWPVPSLALLRGTQLGAADFAEYYGGTLPRFAMRDGRPDFAAGPLPREQWRRLPVEQQFDALLYLGPSSTDSTPSSGLAPDMCTDTEYMPILRARMELVRLQPEIERLEGYCAAAQKQP
jgi:hypothetical protein